MIDFDATGLYEGFAENRKGEKYPDRHGQLSSLVEESACEGFSGKLKSNTVLIDGDKEPYNRLLREIVIGEGVGCFMTDRDGGRGPHAVIPNYDITLKKADNVMLACGIVVDFHPSYSMPYECLKYNGVERKVIYNKQPYQEMPKYFTPIPKCDIDFVNMGEGDGRNSTLFSYILTLQNAGFSEDDIKDTFRIINKYVLKEPLEEKELEVILRDEAFKKQAFYVKNKFSHNKFADMIRQQHYVKKINGQLHIYQDGVYVPGYEPIERAMIHEIPSLTSNQRNEVLKYLNVVCEESEPAGLHLIPFRNGVYNLNTDSLEQFSPQNVITNKIPWNYNPDARSDLVDNVLDKLSCGDREIRYLLEEVAGACLFRSALLGGGKAAILVGDKYNGKTTYIHMVNDMLGEENCSSVDLGQLKERFNTILLYGKLANIGDDISDEYIADTSILKKLITGSAVKAEQKGMPAISYVSYATQIYSANNIPKMKDPTGAMLRRLLLIPLNGKFTKDMPDYDPFIRQKLAKAEHMEYFIQLALDGLADVLENKSFTVPAKTELQKASYEKENNPILAFIEDQGEEMIINEPTNEVYKRYQLFCTDNGFQPGSNITFSKNINRALGTVVIQKKIKGKKHNIFIKVQKEYR